VATAKSVVSIVPAHSADFHVSAIGIEMAVASVRKSRYRSRQAQSGRESADIRRFYVRRQILQQVCNTVA